MKRAQPFFPLLVSIGIFLWLLYHYYYSKGAIIIGGEGSYYTDAFLLLKNYGYLWYNSAVGFFATSFNFVFHTTLIQWVFGSERLVNFINNAMLYLLPFIAMFFVSRLFKLKSSWCLLIALFYVTNPFSANFLKSINPWNMIALYILPAQFFIMYKLWNEHLALFLVFGLHSLFFSYANANPPTMLIYQISTAISIILISVIKNNKLKPLHIARNYLTVLVSFLLFNFWWIINTLYVFRDANSFYTSSFALGWLKSVGAGMPATWRALSLTSILPFPSDIRNDYFSFLFGNIPANILVLFPIAVVTLTAIQKKLTNLCLLLTGLFLIVIGFLAKGTNPPFGSLYVLAVQYLPLFKIFKTAPEKWGILFIFLLTFYLILIIRDINKSSALFKFILLGLVIYVLFCSIPFVSGNFLPDYRANDQVVGSKLFNNKKEYLDLRQTLNSDPLQYRVLSLPGHLNYQIALKINGNKYYTGNDPILTNTNKPFIAQYNNAFAPDFDVLFDNISNPNYTRLLGLYNIKKIVINKDMYPWFGYREKENLNEKESIFNRQYTSSKNSVIDLYDVGQAFVPRFYIADQIIKSDLGRDELSKIITDNNASTRSAIYVPTETSLKQYIPDFVPKANNIPRLSFQKINPTKYKLSFEDVNGPFLLVFSETFHPGWKLYLVPDNAKPLINEKEVVGSYFGGEIKEINPATSFFDKNFYSTWSLSPIATSSHGLVNGYANSWLIDPVDVGGKHNFELILDYWPQRLFYYGAFVTIATLLLSVLILLKKRR